MTEPSTEHEPPFSDSILTRDFPYRRRGTWSLGLVALGFAISTAPHVWRTFPDYQGPDGTPMDWLGVGVGCLGLLVFLATAFSVVVHPRGPVEAVIEVGRRVRDSHPMTKVRLACLAAWSVGGVLYVRLGPWAGVGPWVWLSLTLIVAAVFSLAGKRRADSEWRAPRVWLCLHLLSELLMVSVLLSFFWIFNAVNAAWQEVKRNGLPQWAHGDPARVHDVLGTGFLVFAATVISALVLSMVLGTVSGRRLSPNTEVEDG